MAQQLCTIPCITEIPENYRALWELCLTDVWCPVSLEEWRDRIDSPREIDADSTLFVNLSPSDREELAQVFGFPAVKFPALPSIEQVNQALPSRFETTHLFKQSDVAAGITERIRQELPQIVVLLVFDGLSFYDVVDWKLPQATLEPCLVDGLSVTNSAMQRLIGSPVLTHRLFELGYIRRLGFSYWERAMNALTDVLFAEFPPNQLHRMTTFDEVLRKIKASVWETHTYVQIIRSGLDGVCHFNRERPNIKSILDDLKRDIFSLLEVLQETEKSFRLFITADHGILWYADQDIIPLAQEKFNARYTDVSIAGGDNLLTLNTDEGTYTVLTGDKVIAKQRKVTEWGFHGGVSAQESLVPFWDVRQ
ncbi:hypothetical protein F4009_10570 [Candidatus Poribacteria bacterium]|nr:hypothetical protein [Candidatus Poribacteria bacterium]MYH83258.1 hypothetical protein [Candidatus Poribacteria bacterium]MYK94416.1 hypothetical protein [Candidatus Poribacteria bacterium]